MISDSALKKLSLIIAVFGILALFILTQFLEPQSVAIENITTEMIGQHVLTTGNITSLSIKDGNVFFTLSDNNNQIRAVWFNAKSELIENQFVEIEGTVELYRNELEIIVEKIKSVDA